MNIWSNSVIFCASALVACGTSNSSLPQATDAGNETSAKYSSFCAEEARSTCNSLASCCSVTVERCIAAEESNCATTAPDLTVPGVAFNDSAAQSCISSTPAMVSNCTFISTSSSEYQSATAACRNVVVGTFPVGSECESSNACAPQTGKGMNCQADSSGVKRCTAYALLNEGEACDISTAYNCASGLYCNIPASPSQCTQLKPSGQSCSLGSECVSHLCTNAVCAEPTVASFCQVLTSN